MKKIALSILFGMSCLFLCAGQNNYNISISPNVGVIYHGFSPGETVIRYQPFSINASWEGLNGWAMFELSYTQSVGSGYHTGEYLLPGFSSDAVFKEMTSYYAMAYIGRTYRNNKRFQIPFYAGAGFVFGDIASFAVSAKLRMKYYVTDNFGLFIGFNGMRGFSSRTFSNDHGVSVETDSILSHVYSDIGITFTL